MAVDVTMSQSWVDEFCTKLLFFVTLPNLGVRWCPGGV